MKVFVFNPTNELIGKFDIEHLDAIAEGLDRFARSNRVRPYDYLESSGRTWTIVDGSSGLDLQEGRVQCPQQQTSGVGGAGGSSDGCAVPTPASFVSRYREAYRVGAAAVGFGVVIERIGWFLGAISILGGLIAASQVPGEAAFLFIIYGVIVGAVEVVVFIFFGVLVSAIGQILRSTVDTAVHTSPFLDTQQKHQAMDV